MEGNSVKVATYNINNINKRLDNLLAWLAKAEPDVVSLQELKAEQGAFLARGARKWGICKSFSLIDLSCLLA
jgi:exodeoxyribonuclease-3